MNHEVEHDNTDKLPSIKYEVGDQVVLKSGGPRMVITSIEQSNPNDTDPKRVICTWFSPANGLETRSFDKRAIERYVP